MQSLLKVLVFRERHLTPNETFNISSLKSYFLGFTFQKLHFCIDTEFPLLQSQTRCEEEFLIN